MEFWFRKKFNLAPTDQRFLDATIEQIETEYWAHHYDANPKQDEVEDEDFDLEEEIRKMDPNANPDDWENV